MVESVPMYTDRQWHIVCLRSANPEMKAADIAREIGISREGVRQILNKIGLPTKVGIAPILLCEFCKVENISRGNSKFCSRKCYAASKYIYLKCMDCGIDFKRREKLHATNLKRGQSYIFCGRSCFGRYFGHLNKSTEVIRILEILKEGK
jgi:hypothetical protein